MGIPIYSNPPSLEDMEVKESVEITEEDQISGEIVTEEIPVTQPTVENEIPE